MSTSSTSRRHHPMHHADALLALRAGKPALVEKPFTMNAAEAEELVAEARARGLFLMEAMWARFLPHIGEIRRLLAEGALGDLVTRHRRPRPVVRGGPRVPAVRAEARRRRAARPRHLPGVVRLDGARHARRVVVLSDPAFTGVDAQTSILLGYESGAHAVLTCTLRAAGTTRAAIVGTEGRIEIDGAFYAAGRFTLIPRGGEPQRMFDPPAEGGLRHEADEVARCMEAGGSRAREMPLDETVAIMRTMDAVSRSAAA